jgi:CMP-2-keto-3-deoxyoctulosonic acid synthetase
MNYLETTNFDFNITGKKLPINIYALRILDNEKSTTYDIIINHNGYCPSISSEREQSNYNDYLSNLENEVVTAFFKLNKIRKPKNHSNLFEIMTDNEGALYHYARTSNL